MSIVKYCVSHYVTVLDMYGCSVGEWDMKFSFIEPGD